MAPPRIGSLFTGYGGLDMAVERFTEGDTVWHSDNNRAVSKLLAHRYPGTPNHGDVTTIDWATVEPIDILTGGFPCQDISHAGRRAGLLSGNRSGLWSQMVRAIAALHPGMVVIENVRGLLSANTDSELEYCPWCMGKPTDVCLRALGAVLGDLADLRYNAQWYGLRASDVGAPHGRYRIFIVATPIADAAHDRRKRHGDTGRRGQRFENRDNATANPGGQRYGQGQNSRGMGYMDGQDESPSQQFQRPRPLPSDRGPTDWGRYAAAIARWERVTGRAAPNPTERNKKGIPQLAPAFSEWMMGLPAGWVTGIKLSRIDQHTILGNGVVPQQAYAALTVLHEMQQVAA